MPVILTLCLVGVRIIKRLPVFELTLKMVFKMTLFYAVLFEWMLPHYYPNTYTADFFDVIAYAMGGLSYILVFPQRKKHTTKAHTHPAQQVRGNADHPHPFQ